MDYEYYLESLEDGKPPAEPHFLSLPKGISIFPGRDIGAQQLMPYILPRELHSGVTDSVPTVEILVLSSAILSNDLEPCVRSSCRAA